jgi:hypothetical protein
MQEPPLDPNVADTAPSDSVLTAYDVEHFPTFLRLLDADAEGADWREVARMVLHLDPEHESDRARRRSTAIYRAPNGRRSTVAGTCYVVARPFKVAAPRSRLLFKNRLGMDTASLNESKRTRKNYERNWRKAIYQGQKDDLTGLRHAFHFNKEIRMR